MNNFQLIEFIDKNDVLKRHFETVCSSDTIPKMSKKQAFCIVNLSKRNEEGTHWVLLFKRKSSLFYFDTFGRPPPEGPIRDYCFNHFAKTQFNKTVQQDVNSVSCGPFCLLAAEIMCRGYSFRVMVGFFESRKDDESLVRRYMKKRYKYRIPSH